MGTLFLALSIVLQAGVPVSGAQAADTGHRHAAPTTRPAPATQRADTTHRRPASAAAVSVWPRLTMELGSDDDGSPENTDGPLSSDGFASAFSNAVLGSARSKAVAASTKAVASSPARALPTGAPAQTAQAGTTPGTSAAGPAKGGTRRPRPPAVTYSNGYATRLTIHRIASYAMVPMFICQYITGSQLLAKGRDAPAWALHAHGPLATLTTAIFTTNTVTGVWNMWEARHDPAGRTSRTLHGALMLVSDAGFTTAGLLSARARNSAQMRHVHRAVALSSMGVAFVGYAIMLPPFRK